MEYKILLANEIDFEKSIMQKSTTIVYGKTFFFLYMLPGILLLYLLLRITDRISQKCILMIFISVLSYIGKISFDGSYKNRKPRKNFLSPLISILIFGVLCYVLYLYVLAQNCMRIA